jgi:hypothetical protein
MTSIHQLKDFGWHGLRVWRLGLAVSMAALIMAAPNPGMSQQQASGPPGGVPTVLFTLNFPNSDPDHYSIQIAKDGSSKYASQSKLNPESEDEDTFELEFIASAPTVSKIFDLSSRAKFFEEAIESHKRVASTGEKTLAYRDSQRSFQQTYNYSVLPAVQDLTTFFQNLSLTLEFARRLQYNYRYQKLALDEELKRMEEMQKSNSLIEMQAVQPILSKIMHDPSVINPVRARAQKVLAAAGLKSD